MKKIFIDIARYIAKHPECKKKNAYAIYNSFSAQHPHMFTSMKDVKLIVDYISSLSQMPDNLIVDALQEA